MGSSQKIASGVCWTIFVNIVNGVYGFISVPILIAYFGKGDYGLIGLAISVNIYLRLMDLGMNSTCIRFFSNWLAQGDKEKVSNLFGTNITFYGIIGIINALVLVVLSFYVEDIFNIEAHQVPILRNLFHILAVSAFIGWLAGCFEQLIRANECVDWTQRITLLPKLLQIFILIMTVTCKFSIVLYYALTAFSMFVIIPFFIQKIRMLCPYISFKPQFDKFIVKEILPYSLNIFSFGLFQFSFYNLRPVFLGIRGTMESVADYRILNGIISIVTMLSGAFIGALLPVSSKVVAQDNKEAYYKVAYDGTKYVSILCSFCCFGMMTVGREVILLYVGESYLYLVPWLNIWLLCTLISHNQAISSLILAGADIRAITFNTMVSSITGLLLVWILIPTYQIGGIVIAFCVYGLMQIVFYYVYYWPRKMQINSWRVFSKSFFPTTIIGALLALLLPQISIENVSILFSFCFKGTLFTLLFLLANYLLLTNNEKLAISGILKKYVIKRSR